MLKWDNIQFFLKHLVLKILRDILIHVFHDFSIAIAVGGVHSSYWVDFMSGFSSRFKIEFCVHIRFYII